MIEYIIFYGVICLFIIGLCGGSGSGKGTVSNFFREKGVVCIDTDAIYRDITSGKSKCLDEIISAFGKRFLSPDGSLNRRLLASEVFHDRNKLDMLNSISHRHILNRCREIISEADGRNEKLIVIDAPLLFESGFDSECDIIIMVTAEEETRIRRIMKRDGIGKEQAKARINSQNPDEKYIGKANIIIENDFDVQSLEKKAEKALEIIEKTVESGVLNEQIRI